MSHDDRLKRPGTKAQLRNYVRSHLRLDVPDRRICDDHQSPLDYLAHGFFLDAKKRRKTNSDAIVWANRAGGKTQLASVATLLDCLFKPGCHVRILGGSGEQSSRLYNYVQHFLNLGYSDFLDKPALKSGCVFKNGSTIEMLTQSATSVRGQHVQKLRCDEVELFDPDVLAAAKFTTISSSSARASMEMISTMHKPYGLMSREVAQAERSGCSVFKWCLWETIERCSSRRRCDACELRPDCQGKARLARGYLKIEDAIALMRRSSRASWEAEMLCERPSREGLVFSEFERDVHVQSIQFNPDLPLYRSIDFGFVNPFVCLWMQRTASGTIFILDEYVRRGLPLAANVRALEEWLGLPEESYTATFCDPAGQQREGLSGSSCVRELRAMGIRVRYRASRITEGIELIRSAIRNAQGTPSLFISPRCPRLIEALECYHYPDPRSCLPTGRRGGSERPEKDGVYDHPIDALRYFFINTKRRAYGGSRPY
ncbi:MAG: hypothetical protein JSW66_10730 [Phycisphaerales bacterium]|nr:MAG: hypothetical protein JSW66_10730 [Phycisphaerales bacterium]